MRVPARSAFVLISALFVPALRPAAQQATPYVVGSTISGHVFCADTNAPARFAKVLLKSAAPNHAGEDFMKNIQANIGKLTDKDDDDSATPAKPDTDVQKRAMAAAAKSMNQVTDMLNSSTVGLDGSYSFAGVKPGTYYIHAISAGYIDPFSQLSDEDFASTDPVIKARVAQIPTVTVTGTDSAHADLRLERGAAVSGRVTFDDGTPASGWTLSVIKPKTPEDPSEAMAAAMGPALAMMGGAQAVKTDDHGHYRIAGLAPGEYALKASLIATGVGISATNMGDGGTGINITVFTGDTFSRADAKPFKLTPGDETSGVDITVPAHALHNIVGHVYAKSDGHPLNVGQVTLTTKSNPTLHVTAAIRDDGSFHFEYLPGNITYTLVVVSAADGASKPASASTSFMGMSLPDPEILRKYKSDTVDVILGDTDNDSASLTLAQTDWKPTPKKPGEHDPTPADLLKSIISAGADDKPE